LFAKWEKHKEVVKTHDKQIVILIKTKGLLEAKLKVLEKEKLKLEEKM
jgi:hypothetical protein